MTQLPLTKAPDGRVQLAFWRDSRVHEHRKGDLLRTECIPIKHTVAPYPLGDEDGFYRLDLRKPLPLPANVVDWVHIYHVIEHLNPPETEHYFAELFRIMKPGARLRISIADNELFARRYLKQLDIVTDAPSDADKINYEWSLMRIIDQMVRSVPSGRIGRYQRAGLLNDDFVRANFGEVFDKTATMQPRSIMFRLVRLGPVGMWYSLRRKVQKRLRPRDPRVWGECDRWINDRVFVRHVMHKLGFDELILVDFKTSQIEGWERYNFDAGVDGNMPYEPGSFFECVKPSSPKN